MDRMLTWLMTHSPRPEPISSLDGWWARHGTLAGDNSVERAIAGGFVADRLGYAFASGYQAALVRTFDIDGSAPAAFCATEKRSTHPRDMKCTLRPAEDGYRIDGEKSFVTLGSFATCLLVVVTEGDGEDGRPRLKVVALDVRDGVTVHSLPEGPFMPEIPHASLSLVDVHIAESDVLVGDGYARYLKPFRTVEDIHVHAALLGWLLQLARRFWDPIDVERVLSRLMTIHTVAALDPTSPSTHLALAGAMRDVALLLEQAPWDRLDEPTRTRWERDRVLMTIAKKARTARREAARRKLAPGV